MSGTSAKLPMTGLEQMQQDPRSTDELLAIAIAVAEKDEADEAAWRRMWSALAILHARGTRDVLEAGLGLCTSADPKMRALGAEILGELGSPERTCGAALVGLLHDPDEAVVTQAVFSLGHLRNKRCEPHLLEFKSHASDMIRLGVAFSLAGSETPDAVAALLELMNDGYERVRDWATAGIGHTVTVDGPEIRDALLRRAIDPDDMTRAEALNGLARRQDSRIVPYLVVELETPEDRKYLMADAAKIFLGLPEDAEIEPAELVAALKRA